MILAAYARYSSDEGFFKKFVANSKLFLYAIFNEVHNVHYWANKNIFEKE